MIVHTGATGEVRCGVDMILHLLTFGWSTPAVAYFYAAPFTSPSQSQGAAVQGPYK